MDENIDFSFFIRFSFIINNRKKIFNQFFLTYRKKFLIIFNFFILYCNSLFIIDEFLNSTCCSLSFYSKSCFDLRKSIRNEDIDNEDIDICELFVYLDKCGVGP